MLDIPLDVVEENEAYTIFAEIPGVSPDNIEVKINYDNLEIHIKAKEETEEKYLHRERPNADVVRRLTFNKPINPSEAKTSLVNGVLNVYLPLAETAKKVTLTIE